jgi:hypothetical protein
VEKEIMSRLLVKNKPNSHLKGEVLIILPDSHEFGNREDKIKFIINHPGEVWPNEFVIVNVNCDPSELQHLLETDDDGNKVCYIANQDETSPHYQDLVNYAQCTTTLDYLNSQIVYR